MTKYSRLGKLGNAADTFYDSDRLLTFAMNHTRRFAGDRIAGIIDGSTIPFSGINAMIGLTATPFVFLYHLTMGPIIYRKRNENLNLENELISKSMID